jgi:hypothetical protein
MVPEPLAGLIERGVDVDGRELLANALLVVLSVCVVVAGVEGVLRLGLVETSADYPKMTVCTPDGPREAAGSQTQFEFHPRYGWRGEPGSEFVLKQTMTDDWDRYTHNDRGFRDTVDSGDRSIVFLGDSYVWGWLAGDDATIPYLLDRETPGTAVHNYGQPGYSTAQELLLYRDVAERRDHELVLLGYYANDPRDNLGVTLGGEPYPKRPRFELASNGSLVLAKEPRNVSLSETRSPPDGAVPAVKQFLNRHTVSYSYLAPRAVQLARVLGLVEAPGYPSLPEAEVDYRMRLTRAHLAAIADTAARNDADVLLVAIPPEGVTDPRRRSGAYSPSYWDRQTRMLRDLAGDRENVGLVELQPVLAEEIRDGGKVYGERDAHLTEYGNRVAARVVYDRLAAGGYVEADGDVDFAVADADGEGRPDCAG